MRYTRFFQHAEQDGAGKLALALQSFSDLRSLELLLVLSVLLPALSLLLWLFSLRHVSVYAMNDFGLISVLPIGIVIALVILMASFSLLLYQIPLRPLILIFHLLILILILYGTQNFIEEAPRFGIVYRHAGYTEYIMRTGSVDPRLDAYFSWPGFFVLSAFLTRIAGYPDILSYAGWAPIFYNLLYAGPMFMIFTVLTTNARLIALGLWFFYLTNWIGQDYFSPQGLDFFLYLVIIAIMLKWFTVPAASHTRHYAWLSRHLPCNSSLIAHLLRWLTSHDTQSLPASGKQSKALLCCLLVIFAFIIFSHPLTPFFALASVAALVVFCRCSPRWLPLVMTAMTLAWLLFMTRSFLAGHSSMVIGSVGHVGSSLSSNVTSRVTHGNVEHSFVAAIRIVMTVLVWLLALLGVLRRVGRGHRDTTLLLIAVAPFPLIAAQAYGGEMMLRVYLFTLPMMLFLVAALFYPSHRLSTYRPSWRMIAAILGLCYVLLFGFFFTRYGNERMDYMTYEEVQGLRQLYRIAPPRSLLLQGWSDSPWQFRDYEKYNCHSLDNLFPDVVETRDVGTIVHYIDQQSYSRAYIIFGRTQKVTAESFSGLPSGALDRLESALIKSKKFQVIYSTRDLQILQYVGDVKHMREVKT
jgi:hypothetical protein